MNDVTDIAKLVDELSALHAASCDNLRAALAAYIGEGVRPDPVARAAGAFCYPEVRVLYQPETASWPSVNRAFARMNGPGAYAVSVTRPEVFRDYLIEQLSLLSQDYGVQIEIGLSSQEIPYPYVLDGSQDLPIDQAGAAELSRWFPTSSLADIGDEIPDGVYVPGPGEALPLSLFDAPRIDFSLKRLQHYTGAPAEHTQSFVLFTNYHRYVDEFVRWGAAELQRPGTPYTALSCSGNVVVDASTPDPEATVAAGPWRRHQMPAYHLMAPGGQGITLVNIGVGPSNAKTICDHLAVLRPQAWMMIGHCGGLRGSQKLGDYVLAHAYLRDDHVLDHVLPTEIPIPPIAEVQQALQRAAEIVTGESREALKGRLRTGTIVTTDDRNWELRYALSAVRFNQSRAVGIDMESATIAAQGYRFRVPYGTLLCVSDKPLHGEIKLPGQANRFYEQAISQHLRIGVEAVELLRKEGQRLHSRKLRAFDEPPFR
jgi:AMP nucleosidase